MVFIFYDSDVILGFDFVIPVNAGKVERKLFRILYCKCYLML